MRSSVVLKCALLLTVAACLLELPPGTEAVRVLYLNPDPDNRVAHLLSSPTSSKCKAGQKPDRWGYCRLAVAFG